MLLLWDLKNIDVGNLKNLVLEINKGRLKKE